MSSSGRPVTGFARPGTSSRPTTGSTSAESAFQGDRPGTSRPVTALGRRVRLGTASMLSEAGGPFINVEKLDLTKYAKRQDLAKLLCDYLLYHDHNPQKALELASKATVEAEFKDWWWKSRLGKCYYQLGLLRDAEKQFLSANKDTSMIVTTLELAKVYIRLDQPNKALEIYLSASEKHPGDTQILLSIARIHDMLNNLDTAGIDRLYFSMSLCVMYLLFLYLLIAHYSLSLFSLFSLYLLNTVTFYKKVLFFDASCIEAIACLASHHFYSGISFISY